MRKFFNWFIGLILLLITSGSLQAGIDLPVIKALDGSIGQVKKDSSVMVEDAKFFDANYDALLIKPYTVKNMISFEINEEAPILLQSAFRVTARLRIIYTDVNKNTTTVDRDFTVNYDPGGNYTNRATYLMNNAYRVEVKILQLDSNVNWNVSKTLKLVNQLQSFPQYVFNCSTNAVKAINPLTSSSAGNTIDELSVWWTPDIAADEYDLEWAYIDSTALADSLYGDPAHPDPNLLFESNASRVTITGSAYKIPLYYDNHGYLFYRVRSVQWTAVNGQGGGRYEANWSSQYPNGLGRFDYDGHERKLNWQVTTSFAEEGKRKTMMQYYDGSLRGRQTVTKDNTTDRTIVAESLYDYQGRPVIQVLPAPTLDNVIHYARNFNRGIGKQEYDKSLYDTLGDPSLYCSLKGVPMATSSGASRYYSPDNDSVGSDQAKYKYIPDAKGFPFTEVEYLQDNTGRISRQSGVGPDFRIGSDHETKYFYGSPDQRELDALFGTEVGDKSHYFKNAVRDANGQYSISYADMRGRTIATALAGNLPDSAKLDALASNASSTRIESLSDPASVVVRDMVMEHKKGLLVTTAGNHEFRYQLSPQLLKLEGCDTTKICYDCLYDLEITITDDCNNQKLGGQAFDTVFRNFSIGAIDTICNTQIGFSISFTKWLSEGSYEVTKKLSVSKYALDYYRDSVYLQTNNCRDLESFIREQRQILSGMRPCQPSCRGCVDSVGTWQQFWARFRTNAGIADADTASYREAALKSYDDALASCKELCEQTSEADDIRKAMLLDLTPSSGQYADAANDRDPYSIFVSKDGHIIYQEVTDYRDEEGRPDLVADEVSGNLVSPGKLTVVQFTNRFKPSWAAALLPRHPEYCKLQKYEELKPSHEWDRRFEAVDTYAEAKQKGYLNPTGRSGSPFSYFNGTGTLDPDPISGSLKTSLENMMLQYQSAGGQPVNIWGIAAITAACGDGNDMACFNKYKPGPALDTSSTLCTADRDMAWRAFRQFYLNAKQTVINQWLKDNCPNTPSGATLLNAGHQPHFSDVGELLGANGIDLPTTGGQGEVFRQQNENKVKEYYDANCRAYVKYWIETLSGCARYDTASLNQVIIPRLLEVCREGADEKHPYGSSSVKPSSTYRYRSFEEVLKDFNRGQNITNNNCNAYGITAPKPYDQQAINGNKPMLTAPDSCECALINNYHQRYLAVAGSYSSFSDYMQRVYNTQVSDSALNLMMGLCNGATTCNYLEAALVLPPAFQCGSGDICIDCERFRALDNEFKSKYPGVMPIRDLSVTDSVQLSWNTLYEQFMNYKTGFNKTVKDYLDFAYSCDGQWRSPGCDSLNKIVTDFKIDQQNKYGVKTEFSTQEGELFTDLHDLVRNGAIQLPDTVRARPGQSYNNVGFYLNNRNSFCTSAGYSIEFRMRMLPSPQGLLAGHVFYAGTSLQCTFGRYSGGYFIYKGDTIRAGLYIQGMVDDAGHRYGYDFGDSLFSYLLVDSNPDIIADWFTLKVQITPSKSYLYFNGRLIIALDRNPALPIASISSFGMGIRGRHGNMDWAKVYDNNGQVRYFEDFLDPDNPALPDATYFCTPPSGTCQSRFVQFFNQRQGTSYSSAEIDSIYLRSCGRTLNACGPVAPSPPPPMITLCGRSEPVFPPVALEAIDNCSDSSFFIVSKSQELHKTYLDSLRGRFDSSYIAHCMQAYKFENFTVKHTVSEYHYTLYYYDQAGNLVKTIPPAGVRANHDSLWLDSVRIARIAGTVKVPQHEMPTQYRYNTLNQLVGQQSPDGGQTAFWYDRLGRLVLSQNARQKAASVTEDNRLYSYTQYDHLSRITEVGQLKNLSSNPAMADSISRNPDSLDNWLLKLSGRREQITQTVYDTAYAGFVGALIDARLLVYQRNLRNRVSYITYSDGTNPSAYNQGTFYTYDIHGNVDTLLQDYGCATCGVTANVMNRNGNRFKKIGYQYDLISGKVNMVQYQRGWNDQFFHRYSYDGENRLTLVETSLDSMVWEKDARYGYYLHGPLARTVVGTQQVQGLDYAYTLQGWLKGVNSTGGMQVHDMGGDGKSGSRNQYIGRDAIGFSLHYFAGDYTAIHSGVNPFPSYSAYLNQSYRPLFNGNISSMASTIRKFDEPNFPDSGSLFYNYRYDQLNRLTGMDVYRGFNRMGNHFTGLTPLSDSSFLERIAYDANGNILKYLRHATGYNSRMDSLSYSYYPGTNRLKRIRDNVAFDKYGNNSWDVIQDIDDQEEENNYVYDEIGNLVQDKGEKLTDIQWNVYGKIVSITRTATDRVPVSRIEYRYDGQGHRIGKVSVFNGVNQYTWYVRDAQGNVLSTYKASGNDAELGNLGLEQGERYIYGSNRLGVYNLPGDVDHGNSGPSDMQYYGGGGNVRGWREYELSNHLGNVLTTVNDYKIGIPDSSNGSLIGYYEPRIVSANEYYPFGMLMRVGTTTTGQFYRYGFNGKENDWEAKGWMNQVDYGNRVQDSRIGRWLSLDPLQKKYPNESNYAFVSNNPILYQDADGKDKIVRTTVINKDGTVLKIERRDTKYFEYRASPTYGGGYSYNKRDVYIDITIDQRESAMGRNEVKNVDVSYGPPQELGLWQFLTSSATQKMEEFTKGIRGNRSGETIKDRWVILGSGGDPEWQNGLPKAGDRSEIIDLGDWLDYAGGLREGATAKDLAEDFSKKPNFVKTIQKLYQVIDAADKILDANGGKLPTLKKELPPDVLNSTNNQTPRIEPSKSTFKKRILYFEVDSIPGYNYQPGDTYGKYHSPEKNDTIYKIKKNKQ